MLSNRHRHSTESSMFKLSMMYLWVLYLYFGEAINIIYFVTFCLLKAYLNSWGRYASWLWEESWYMFQDWPTRRNHWSQVAERGLSNQPSSDPSVSLSHWNEVPYPVPVCFNKCWITGPKKHSPNKNSRCEGLAKLSSSGSWGGEPESLQNDVVFKVFWFGRSGLELSQNKTAFSITQLHR